MISRWAFRIFFTLGILFGTAMNLWFFWTDATYSHVKLFEFFFTVGLLVVWFIIDQVVTLLDLDKKYELHQNWKRIQKMAKLYEETPLSQTHYKDL